MITSPEVGSLVSPEVNFIEMSAENSEKTSEGLGLSAEESGEAALPAPRPSEIQLQALLGYQFQEYRWLSAALTHKSVKITSSKAADAWNEKHNERLEFLGDSVLAVVLSQVLMVAYPGDSEGALSRKRASLVNESTLCEIARELDLMNCLRLGKGEENTGGRNKSRILASTLEAILGAVFSDGGFEAAAGLVRRLFASRLTSAQHSTDYLRDYKTRLQEELQKKQGYVPQYFILSEVGPDHEKIFESEVRVGSTVLGRGQGRTKKQAEQEAARQALEVST